MILLGSNPFDAEEGSEFGPPIQKFHLRETHRVSDGELLEGYATLHRASEAIEAERLRWLAEIERRKLYRRDGCLSSKAWLASKFDVAPGTASEQVRVAAALEEMPEVKQAFSAGDVSSSAVRVLASVRQTHPEAFASQEEALVEAAQSHSVAELSRIGAAWCQAVDRALERTERQRDRRRVDIVPTPEGMMRIQGELDAESGEVVATAVRAICDSEVRSGRAGSRTPAQLRADAVTELADHYLSRPDRPSCGGERPHIELTMKAETFFALKGYGEGESAADDPSAELDHGGIVHPEVARRLACDAGIRRLVLDPQSQPLDVGRKSQVVSAPLRRAVIARDRHCRAPGCDRPPGWTDVHHTRTWLEGGSTRLENLVLLCRSHHRMVHEGGFGVRMVGGRPVFSRPDGSTLSDPARPP